MSTPACVLTIAGTDPSGGAGIQADLKTFQEFACYGMSVITSVTAQNTTGVQAVHHIPLKMMEQQLESVLSDMPIHAFKTGMIANIGMMQLIERKRKQLQIPYILDPVMIATSGDALMNKDAQDFLCHNLLQHAALATPNLSEAEYITGQELASLEDMELAAKQIVQEFGAKAALVKGGHMEGNAIDVLFDGTKIQHFYAKRIATKNTHGTGCTYSAAITALMAKGLPLIQAVQQAKDYVTAAISQSFSIGKGNGPTNHWAVRQQEVYR